MEILFEKKQISPGMKTIQSIAHRIGTHNIKKSYFSCFDAKRYILDDGIKTLA